MKALLLATCSYRALFFYWERTISKTIETDIEKEKSMNTLIPASSIILSQKDVTYNESVHAIPKIGYVRQMQLEDIVKGSCADTDWFGYFDPDGDLVFWDSGPFVGWIDIRNLHTKIDMRIEFQPYQQ